jgi:hypothetical protein
MHILTKFDAETWAVGTYAHVNGPQIADFCVTASGPRMAMISLCNFLNGGKGADWRSADAEGKIKWR